jgi:DNA polymerase I-like protein with 3'-5' exonuclease and polymerase domains
VLRVTHQWKELQEIWKHKQDLIRVLLSMKRHGVRIDVQLAEEYVQLGEQAMSQIEKELGINPASPKQMKKLLIDELGLPS